MMNKTKLVIGVVAVLLIATFLLAQNHTAAILDVAQTWTATQSYTASPSILATGIIDGDAPITITTGTSATLGAGTYMSGYTFNQEATAGQAVTYTLPATSQGRQYCVKNSIVSGTGAADTGAITVYPPSGSFVILNGIVNTVGGGGTHGVVSVGAAADSACFVAIDSTHWDVYVQSGTWTEN